MNKHILLVGMPGSGKTTMARKMATERGVVCYEVDEMLELKWGKSIVDFVEENGWEKFREEEFSMVKSFVNEPAGIISAGAGFFTTEEKIDFSMKHFEVLYLKVSVDELFNRLNTPEERAKRPLLSEGDLRLKLEALLAEREKYYSFGSIIFDDQSDFVRSIAEQSITSGDQSNGVIGTIDRKAIDSKN